MVIERSQVAFNLRSNYWLDLNELEAAVDRLHGKRPPQPGLAPRQLTEATKLYRGDLLQGFEVQDAPDFELWMLAERGRQRERMVQILSWLVESSIEQRRWRAGIDAARRLLQIEPWRETAHRQLMLLLARDGQRSAALV